MTLLGKITAWLVLNLLLLGAAFFFLFQTQFKFELDALMAGPAGDRVQAVTQTILGALRSSPPEEWDAVLQSFGSAYKVDFILLDSGGRQIAGAPLEIPEPVLRKTEDPRIPGGDMRRGPPPGKGPRRPWGELNPPLPIQPRFTVRTEDPRCYWVGLRLPPIMPLEGERPMPWTLLLAANSLYNGGLFLDLKLWLLAGAATILISVLLWVPLVRGLTRSVTRLTRATDEIASGNFSVRVPDTSSDELGQLGRSVNRMADRLNGFVKGQKRFLGDTAHELCSPIARMQVAIELLDGSASDAQKTRVRDLREEVDEMSALINELLSFSKAGLASQDTPLEKVPLAVLAAEAVRRENASGSVVELKVREDLIVLARPDLLRRAIANLVRNAVRYAGPAGPILVSDEPADQGHVCLIIRDQGPGVAEPDLQRVFDPFYRAEQSRSRDTGGAGLGLAIVKTCVEACGGTVRASNLKPKGFQIALRLRRA